MKKHSRREAVGNGLSGSENGSSTRTSGWDQVGGLPPIPMDASLSSHKESYRSGIFGRIVFSVEIC